MVAPAAAVRAMANTMTSAVSTPVEPSWAVLFVLTAALFATSALAGVATVAVVGPVASVVEPVFRPASASARSLRALSRRAVAALTAAGASASLVLASASVASAAVSAARRLTLMGF